MSHCINFRRSYTGPQWEKLEQARIAGGYESVSDMIRKKIVKLVNNTDVCDTCVGVSTRRFDKNLKLILPSSTTEKLYMLAKERNLTPGEFIARSITDPLI